MGVAAAVWLAALSPLNDQLLLAPWLGLTADGMDFEAAVSLAALNPLNNQLVPMWLGLTGVDFSAAVWRFPWSA